MNGRTSEYAPLLASNVSSVSSAPTSTLPHTPPMPSGSADIVQFAAPVWYVKEEEGIIRIEVIRIGRLGSPCSVKYETADSSAKAGDKYLTAKGMLQFEAGEHSKSFQVEIIDDDAFDTTIEFDIFLSEPRNCTLQTCGQACRVMILDDDPFPANRFKDALQQENAEEVLHSQGFRLLWGYIRFCWDHVPDIKRKSIIVLLLAQLGNLYYFSMILLKVYLVDTCLNLKEENSVDNLWIRWGHSDKDNRKSTAIFLGLMYIWPNIFLTGSDWYRMRSLEMGFTIRRHLRVSLFRKYLNYTEESRKEVPIQDLKTSMMEDIPDVVSNGYLIIFELWRIFGKIVMVGIFMLKKETMSALPMAVYGILIFMFLTGCHNKRMKLLMEQGEGESKTQGYLIHASNAQRLIDDYKQQGFVVRRFEDELMRQRRLNTEINSFNFLNELLIPWITLLSIGGYMAFGAYQVIDDDLQLGSYLAMLNVYKDLGDRFEGVYACFSSMTECIEPLVGLTLQLNLPTALPKRKHVHEMRNKIEKEEMQTMPSDNALSVYDRLPIGFRSLTLPHCPAFQKPQTLMTPQGAVICVTGKHELGKATVLHLLTDHVVPLDGDEDEPSWTSGQVFCPLHLRFLNVSGTPLLVESESMFDNLAFGSTQDTKDVSRVKGILRRLQLDKPWIMEALESGIAAAAKRQKEKMKRTSTGSPISFKAGDASSSGEGDDSTESTEDGEEDESWQDRLSTSELKRLHLARAFIFNPEVMLLHRPLDGLDDDIASRVLGLMREFVDGRGVEMNASAFHLRRPRTLFFTCGRSRSTDIADAIWSTEEGQVKQLPGTRRQ